MKINWKIRFQNKSFLITFLGVALTFVYTILGMFDVVPSVTQNTITDAVVAVINVLAAMGIVVDPTTKGMTDSSRALEYTHPNSEK